jgi:hypothetical protein
MATPEMRSFTIRSIGDRQVSPTHQHYLECRTDEGVVAFWGSDEDVANILVVMRLKVPCKLTCESILANWSKHTFWVPETARFKSLEPL